MFSSDFILCRFASFWERMEILYFFLLIFSVIWTSKNSVEPPVTCVSRWLAPKSCDEFVTWSNYLPPPSIAAVPCPRFHQYHCVEGGMWYTRMWILVSAAFQAGFTPWPLHFSTAALLMAMGWKIGYWLQESYRMASNLSIPTLIITEALGAHIHRYLLPPAQIPHSCCRFSLSRHEWNIGYFQKSVLPIQPPQRAERSSAAIIMIVTHFIVAQWLSS